jgi:HSP20 family molecular chaperone IbpA
MAEDVEVTVDGQKVRISAAMRTPAEKDYRLHEWHYGPFERIVEIPKGFGKSAAGSFGNGQLAIRLERGEGEQSGRLELHPHQS